MRDPISVISKFATGITPKGWFVIALVGALIATVTAAVMIADNAEKRKIDTAKEAGANDAIVAGQNDILNQVEQANNAQNEIDRGDADAAFKRCMSTNATAATRASCDRFRTLPD